MNISFINAGLAAGAALAIVPVILHLIMRQTPKRVVFPALRLLERRHQRSTKRLRIKNWLLLLARMALIALLALALARPALNARVPLGDREVPTALGLVIDTSLSMGYVDQGQPRLEKAKQMATEILRRLPETSEVYLIDSGIPAEPAPISPSAARQRLESLELRAANRPLNQALERAYNALADSRRDLPRMEAYVFTDLARSAWELGQQVPGREQAEEQTDRALATYVINLAPSKPSDAAVVGIEARPAPQPIQDGGRPFQIVGTIRNSGEATTRLVSLVLDGQKRGQKQAELPADGQAEVQFETPPNLEPGLHQAELRLEDGVDSLSVDDRRFVTFEARPAFNVLVVYDPDSDAPQRSIDAFFIAGALDPQGFGNPYQVEILGTNQLRNDQFPRELSAFACVFINNVARLPESCWDQLSEYVRNGGGVVIGLGENTDIEHYNSPMAQRVVPGEVGEPVSITDGTAFGELLDQAHPLFSPLTQALAADLANVPIYKYTRFQPEDPPDVRPLLAFQDGAPALVESLIDGPQIGRVLLWTTPLSRRPSPGDPDAWNEFPVAGWSFLALIQRTVPYLAGASGTRLNYEAGEVVILPLDPDQRVGSYVVQGPKTALTERINPPRDAEQLVIEGPEALGHWSVTPASSEVDRAESTPLGFSINPKPAEADFRTLNEEELTGLIGDPEAFALAENPDDLERAKKIVRVGREVYPWLLALLLLVLTAENFLANRFHRSQTAQTGSTAHAPA